MMIDLTWHVFSQTGNIDTYLLLKELEKDDFMQPTQCVEEIVELNFPIN